jgi:hypothetical protein
VTGRDEFCSLFGALFLETISRGLFTAGFRRARRCRPMRATNQNANEEKPFQKAMKKKGRGRDTDARTAGFARGAQRRNARQMPTRQLQRGR